MKKLLILTITLFSLTISAQKINWMSLEEAVEAQKTTPKKIFIDAYTLWCGPCKMLDKNTFANKDIANFINENFYAVKFNAEGNESIDFKGNTFTNPKFDSSKGNGRNSSHQLSQYFSIRAYPTLVFLDEEANLIAPIPGYKKVPELELHLKLFGSDDYKNIQTKEAWESYLYDFKYEFKE